MLQETWFTPWRFFTSYFIDVDTFYLFLNLFSTRVSNDQKYLSSNRLYACIIHENFIELSSQNVRGFDHTTILSPSFHGLRKERLAQWPAFCVLKYDQNFWGGYFQKNWEGVCGTLPETLTLFQTKICDFPYPISDLIKNLIPYFRPEALEPGAWPERVTSC